MQRRLLKPKKDNTDLIVTIIYWILVGIAVFIHWRLLSNPDSFPALAFESITDNLLILTSFCMVLTAIKRGRRMFR